VSGEGSQAQPNLKLETRNKSPGILWLLGQLAKENRATRVMMDKPKKNCR